MGNNLIKFNFDYSREDDVLILSRPKGKSKEIIESSDFIIYGLDRKGGLNHLEISGAKDFFKTIAPKLNLDFLENLESVKLEQKVFRGVNFIVIWIKLKNFPNFVPQQLPPLYRRYESPLLTNC
ncbi:hypothetical protein HOC13_04545 [Candidatus Woesearchaeota archaeon]|jgi:hypothetical protein|nr:hypothetical protein [Candidatus Woesearchaeota archaeon]